MPVDLSGTMPTSVPGVYMKPGVILGDEEISFLRAVRSRIGFDIAVTSGTRTPHEQASAMLTKFNLGGAAELMATYSNKAEIQRMLDNYPKTLAGFTQAVHDQISRGVYMSRHLRSDAVDFRMHGLTPSEQEALQAAAYASGAKKVLVEGVPPHIHVDGFSGGVLATVQAAGPWVVLGGTIASSSVAAIALWLIWRNRERLASWLPRGR